MDVQYRNLSTRITEGIIDYNIDYLSQKVVDCHRPFQSIRRLRLIQIRDKKADVTNILLKLLDSIGTAQ